MTGYTPLFQSIVTSSIWNESDKVRLIWITMLALADSKGLVEASIPGLAHVAHVGVEDCQKAIDTLMSPDPYSRTPHKEGRRIEKVEGGWRIVNHSAYRSRAKSRAEYMREYRAQKRKEAKENNKNTNINTNANTNTVTDRNTHITEICYTLNEITEACERYDIPITQAQSYYDQYNSQGWRKGNGQLITDLKSHMTKRWLSEKQCWDFDENKTNAQQKSVAERMEELRRDGKL